MVLFINGAFGVGKTTVAQSLKGRLPNSIIFDPEKIGFLLRRLPRWAPLNGHGSGDYQDMPLWRELSTHGIRLARLGWRHILVPMAFTNLACFKSIAEGVAKSDPDVRHFCLVAPLEVVRERLLKRGS